MQHDFTSSDFHELTRLLKSYGEVNERRALEDHDLLLQLHQSNKALAQKLDALCEDHEARIRELERSRNIGYGVVITVSVLLSWIVNLFTSKK